MSHMSFRNATYPGLLMVYLLHRDTHKDFDSMAFEHSGKGSLDSFFLAVTHRIVVLGIVRLRSRFIHSFVT